MSQVNLSSFGQSLFIQSSNKKIKKNEEKDQAEMIHLLSQLEKMVGALAGSSQGAPLQAECSTTTEEVENSEETPQSEPACGMSSTCGTDGPVVMPIWWQPMPVPGGCPTTSEMASCIAATTTIMSQLQEQIDQSTDESYKADLQVMIAQMQMAVEVMQTYIDTVNTLNSQWDQFCQWMYNSENNGTFNAYISKGHWEATYYYKNDVDKFFDVKTRGDDVWVSESDWAGLEKCIEDEVSSIFGFSIDLHTEGFSNAQDIYNSAYSQVEAGINQEIKNAADVVYSFFMTSNNPILKHICALMFSNTLVTGEAMQMIEAMLNELLKQLSSMSLTWDALSDGPSNGQCIQVLTIMNNTLNAMETIIAQTASDKGKNDTKIASSLNKEALHSLKEVQSQLRKIAEELAKQKKLEETDKNLMLVAGILMCIMTLGAGSAVLVAITVTMVVLAETGVLDQLKTSISDSLQKEGMSKEEADIFADVLVVVIVAVATLGAGALEGGSLATLSTASEEGVAEGAEEAEVVAAEESSASALTESNLSSLENIENQSSLASSFSDETVSTEETVTSATETSAEGTQRTLATQFKDSLQYIYENIGRANPLRMLSKEANLAIVNSIQTASSVDLAGDSVTYDLRNSNLSETDKMKRKMNAEIAMMSAAAVVGLLAMDGMAASPSTEAGAGSIFSSAKNFFLKHPEILKILMVTNSFAIEGARVGVNTAKGVSEKKRADMEKLLGESRASLILYNSMQDINNQQMQQSQSAFAKTIKSHNENDYKTNQNILSFETTLARILAQPI
ncbi:MAG: hypothetical protein EBZ47_07055 [Chlamydiae bacterium]|nr:hypothetical protein [Chlamydiota bacterium]